MAEPRTLFDAEGLVEDVRLTTHPNEDVARPARVGFLAGMLAVWATAEGRRLTAAERERLRDVARDAIRRAQEVLA